MLFFYIKLLVFTRISACTINVNLEGNKSEEYNLAVWEKDDISSYSIRNDFTFKFGYDGVNKYEYLTPSKKDICPRQISLLLT